MSTLQLSDCTEFELIPPEQYDRNASHADDITKRPLGYMVATAQSPVVQSEIKNPCVYVKNLTSRDVEVMVSQYCIYYACQLSRIMREFHACRYKTVISRIQTNFSRLADNSKCNCLKTFEKSSKHLRNLNSEHLWKSLINYAQDWLENLWKSLALF